MQRNPFIDDECICVDSDPEISSGEESPFEFVPPTQKKRKAPAILRNPEAKCWLFTINNPTDNDYPCLALCPDIERCIFQLEKGISGTPHLQGYCYHFIITYKYRLRGVQS